MQEVEIKSFKIIGIGLRTTNRNNKVAKDIGELWQYFIKEGIINKIPNKLDDTVYSLYTYYEGDHTEPYIAMLGCKVDSLDDIPMGMIGKSIENGKYAKITVKGDLSKGLIVDQWSKIWNMELNRLFTSDFEVFGKKAQNPSDAEVDFCIAIK